MKVTLKNGHIEIVSSRLVEFAGSILRTPGNVRAMALFPFILLRDDINQKLRPYIINHELIHFRQTLETLFVAHIVISLAQSLYYRLIKRKKSAESYILNCFEQESFRHMYDLDYLKERSIFAWFKYLKEKPVSRIDSVKEIYQHEGFPIVYEWFDEPFTKYDTHHHKGRVRLFIVEGSVTIYFPDRVVELKEGDRFDVPIGGEHTAEVGSNGCRYVVGQEIEGDN
jgi:mannose-6-phosphate isomerase-like protein (cupin superfamily)